MSLLARCTPLLAALALALPACTRTTTTTGPQFRVSGDVYDTGGGGGRTGNVDRVTVPGPRTAPPSNADANTDPCATTLHDLAGPLLFYYQAHNGQLPPTLAALRESPAWDPSLSLVCPVSKQPYVYDPDGIPVSDNKGRAILYDPAPSHAGVRWALTFVPPQDDRALVAKVIVLPESVFAAKAGRR